MEKYIDFLIKSVLSNEHLINGRLSKNGQKDEQFRLKVAIFSLSRV